MEKDGNEILIGLKPKFINDLQRLEEVKVAIKRYYDNGLSIPKEWVEEYNELSKIRN